MLQHQQEQRCQLGFFAPWARGPMLAAVQDLLKRATGVLWESSHGQQLLFGSEQPWKEVWVVFFDEHYTESDPDPARNDSEEVLRHLAARGIHACVCVRACVRAPFWLKSFWLISFWIKPRPATALSSQVATRPADPFTGDEKKALSEDPSHFGSSHLGYSVLTFQFPAGLLLRSVSFDMTIKPNLVQALYKSWPGARSLIFIRMKHS